MARGSLLAIMLALAAVAGTVDLFAPDGQRVGTIKENPGGRVDVFDAESRRIGWGRRNRDGSIELFDTDGRRVGVLSRDGKTLRLERKRGQR